MFDCPHCGEPLEDDAESCPACGSDRETGWNPDVDYYSVELPEDDDPLPEHGPSRPSPRSRPRWAGISLVLIGLVSFVWVGATAYSRAVVFPLCFLLICALFYLLGTRRPER